MRVLAGLFVILVSTAVAALSLAPARGGVAAPAPAAAAAPLATADPSVTARTDPIAERGRTLEDRLERRVIHVSGLSLPIDGVAVPTDEELLPNSERSYRAGWHEGIDFPAPEGTPVKSVAAGTIVRIDHQFTDWTPTEEHLALDDALRLGYTPSATLDRIRGRQVWIDHGNGVVSRYAHLSAVADLAVGDAVAAGVVVGAIGSSGYREGGPHLHLEIRIGTSYLGDGQSGEPLRATIAAAFGY